MNVFVESNFVLELAFVQQEHSACEKLLLAAEVGQIHLFLPVYSLTEVFQTLGSRRTERAEVERFVRQEIKQHLREVGVVTADMESLGTLLRDLLLARTEVQTANLFAVTAKLARIARLLPLTTEVVEGAQQAQLRHSLTPQDALVFASVYAGIPDNEVAENIFVSRNEADFKKPELLLELRSKQCDYLSSFEAVVGRLRL